MLTVFPSHFTFVCWRVGGGLEIGCTDHNIVQLYKCIHWKSSQTYISGQLPTVANIQCNNCKVRSFIIIYIMHPFNFNRKPRVQASWKALPSLYLRCVVRQMGVLHFLLSSKRRSPTSNKDKVLSPIFLNAFLSRYVFLLGVSLSFSCTIIGG